MTVKAQAVLDTNVLVSGLLSPYGPPGVLVDALLGRQLKIALDDRLLLEYRAVLSRAKFGFNPAHLETFFMALSFQERVTARPWKHAPSPDPEDTMFLEVAAAAGVPLVSGNLKHFPKSCRGGVKVFSPAEFLQCHTAGNRAKH